VTARSWALALAVMAAAGCAAGDDDDDDIIVFPDAGASASDAAPVPYCEMSFGTAPVGAQAPATVTVTGAADKHDVFGLETFSWSVTRSGADVPWLSIDPDDRTITFEADVAGPYRISLQGNVGVDTCLSSTRTINVAEPAAASKAYRLLLVPPPQMPAPPQVQPVSVQGGADFDLGDRNLEGGLAIAGALTGPGGVPITGYLRAVHSSDPALAIVREAFAGTGGVYNIRLLSGSYDLLVVPNGSAVAPQRFAAVTTALLAGTISVPAADTVTGTVLASDGSPLTGVRVALSIDGIPSTIATTDATGAFSLLARTGGATAVTVVPLDDMLPQLDLPVGAGLVAVAGTPLEIRYAAGTGTASHSFTVVASDGTTPVPGATVSFISRAIPAAGTVTPAGGAALAATGSGTVVASADGAGVVGPLLLVPALYDVVVAPPLGASGADASHIITVDLSGPTPPTSVDLAVPAVLLGKVTTLAIGDRVTAVPRGLLARAGAPTVEAVVDDPTAAFALDLIGGGEYDVTIHARPAIRRAPVRLSVVAPSPGATLDLATIDLPRAIKITGVVDSSFAGGVSGVTVALLCDDCTGPDAVVPIAETVSGTGGAFTLLAADPGTTK